MRKILGNHWGRLSVALAVGAAACDSWDVDPKRPNSIVSLQPCVALDGGPSVGVTFQALDGSGVPLSGVTLDWELLPADAGLSFGSVETQSNRELFQGLLAEGLATATIVDSAGAARDIDVEVVAFADLAPLTKAFVRIPRPGVSCTAASADAGSVDAGSADAGSEDAGATP